MTKAEKDGETPAPGVASGSSMKMEAEAEAAFDDAFGVKEGAEMGLEDWNMGEDICGSCAVDEPDAEAEDGMWPNSEPSSSNNMCCFCGQYPKKQNQAFCAMGCEADVRAAARDAKAQGAEELKHFQQMRRRGGPDFINAVMVFKSKCQGSGRGWRRPCFSWARYSMLLKMESGIQKGTKSIYCAKGTFCRMMMEEHEWTKERAIQEWFNEYERAKQQKRVSENGLKILMPVEDFLISYQDKSKADLVEMGTKDVKNPSDQQIAERVGWCGTDHESFGSEFFAGALGLEKSAFDGHQDNVFSKSSAPSKEQQEEEDTKQEADAEKKERAKAKAEAKKAEKVFEKEAVLSTVLPLINKHWRSSRNKCRRRWKQRMPPSLTSRPTLTRINSTRQSKS